jgi:2-methylcitrate dehydratase PrpD
MRAVRATVTMKNGDVHKQEITYRSGHWKNPITDDDLKAKFRNLAGRVVTPESVTEIEGIVMNLDTEAKPAPRLGAALQTLR